MQTRGDALARLDPPVTGDQVLGRVTHVQRGDGPWRVPERRWQARWRALRGLAGAWAGYCLNASLRLLGAMRS